MTPPRPAAPAPAQTVRAEGGFAYGAVGADVHVFGDGLPLYLLENWRPPPDADPEFLREPPSRMLNARFAVVAFTGRERESAELHGWCTSGPRRAARLLHGPGGQGKSRLAGELARRCRSAGWKVVTAVHGPGAVLPPPGSQDLTVDGAAGLLVLVDYADRWPLSHLAWLFSNALLHRAGLPVRVLLLARGADGWPALCGVLADEQIDTSSTRLRGLPGTGGARRRMFTAARDSFAARYAVADPAVIAPPASLDDDPALGLTLAVHTAALVAVDAHHRGVRPPADPVALTVYLLDREHAHWVRRHGDHRRDRMHRSVFAAALTGPASRAGATAALARLRPPADAAGLLADHAACYPPADPARDTVLEPLYPDRLAEDFVALTLPGHHRDHPTPPWAAPDLRTLLTHEPGGRGLALLVAAADRWPHVGEGHLYPLLRDEPGLAVAAGSPVLTALAGLPDLAAYVIDGVSHALPESTPADLEPGAAALGVRRSREILARPGDPAAQAMTRVNLAGHLNQLARPAEALDATRQAVATWRDLLAGATGADRDVHRRHLAQGLTNLGNALSRVHRPAEALAALLEAVTVNRARPAGEREHDLAVSLSNLAVLLKQSGRPAHAVEALTEAVTLYRELARTDADHESGLAVALTNLGGTLAGAGRTAQAVDPTREAVRIWRRLTAADPDAHESHLALALANLTALLQDTDGVGDRLPVVEEAAAILRRLAGANPHAYGTSCAVALTLLTRARYETGQPGPALEAAREAAAAHRDLARDEGTGHAVLRLAETLRLLGTVAAAAGRPGEADAAHAEADAADRTVQDWLRRVGFPDPAVPPEAAGRTTRRADAAYLPPPGDAADPPPWRTPRDIARAGRDLARAGRWAALWELACAVPLPEAAALARMLPLERWNPPGGPRAQELAWRLSAVDRRQVLRLAAAAYRPALVVPFPLGFGAPPAFAPDGGAFARQDVEPPDGTRVTVYDLATQRQTRVYRGRADHRSLACLGARSVVAVRDEDPDTGAPGCVVWYHDGHTEPLLPGTPVDGAAAVATAYGVVVGLGTAPVAFAGAPGRPLHPAGLAEAGLRRAGLLAAGPDGTRVAVSDGGTVAVADADLRGDLITAPVPTALGRAAELAFTVAGDLLVAGARGGLLRYRTGPDGLHPDTAVGTPPLTNLFAVPAWRTVGGWALSEGTVHFLDDRTLQRLPPPPGLDGRPWGFAASPDGRYAVHHGHHPAAWPRRARGPAWRTDVHDLHQPAAWLRRPLESVTAAELGALERLLPSADGLRRLLQLVRDLVALRLDTTGDAPGAW